MTKRANGTGVRDFLFVVVLCSTLSTVVPEHAVLICSIVVAWAILFAVASVFLEPSEKDTPEIRDSRTPEEREAQMNADAQAFAEQRKTVPELDRVMNRLEEVERKRKTESQ
jgi:hypothetical protein